MEVGFKILLYVLLFDYCQRKDRPGALLLWSRLEQDFEGGFLSNSISFTRI